MIELKSISKTYKSKKSVETKALNNINLKFGDCGLIFIVGKSGSCKSTLLNLLGGLDSPDKGSINIDNVDICKLNNKELDKYRNSYVGFIFQEFNLLEEFNVEENIDLSLKLQNINDDKKINQILKDVDLKGYNDRNINELSGGQKQRASIARALIKNPKLILADEPTGNLDRKSSDQIFNILKEISKDELVIVVSHDIESANLYADRIIRIEDGKIVDDNMKGNIDKKEEVISFNESKLPFSYIFKMSYSYIMSKPFGLVMTILLTMMSLSFMCFTINVYLFNGIDLHVNTIKDNEFNTLNIDYREIKIDEHDIRGEQKIKLEKENIDYLENTYNLKANKEYTLYEKGKLLQFSFGKKSEEYEDNEAFTYLPSNFRFVELEDNSIINVDGDYPKSNDEIVIHKYFADYMIYFGIIDSDGNLYKPSNYSEIIKDKKKIRLSNHDVRIVGIVKDDNHLYTRAFKTGEFWSKDLKSHYNNNYSSKASIIYVNKDFINNIDLDNSLDLSNIKVIYNDVFSEQIVDKLNDNINIIDLNGEEKTINKLDDNEVVISIDTLRLSYDNYNSGFEKYLKDNSELTYNELLKNYTIEYVKNNDLNNSKIEMIDYSIGTAEKTNMKLIGIVIEEKNYISDSYNGKGKNPKVISSIYAYCNDTKMLTKIFDELTTIYSSSYFDPGVKYFVSYDNSDRVSSIVYAYTFLKKYLLTLSIIFTGFTSLLILAFISNSITNYKKEIGILRSIGTTNKAVIKVFGCEALLIAFLSWIFGTIIWIIECYVLNDSIFGNMYFTLNGIVLNPIVTVIVLIFNVIISILITILLINKINEVKPIDVILDR